MELRGGASWSSAAGAPFSLLATEGGPRAAAPAKPRVGKGRGSAVGDRWRQEVGARDGRRLCCAPLVPYSALGPGGAPPPGAGRPSPPPRPLSSRSPRRAASLTAAPNPRRGTASPPRLQSIFATTVEEKGAPLFNLPWRRTRAEEGGLPRAATPHRGGHRRCTYTSWLRGRLPPRLLDPR
jgi:hypothetical protein